jgi:hypothetical protein
VRFASAGFLEIAMDEDDDDHVYELLRSAFFPIDPLDIPAEVLPRVVEIVRERHALSKVIEPLGKRLAAGDTSVRGKLNPAINRDNVLAKELFEVQKRFKLFGPPIMYGPPWSFDGDE